MNVRQRSIDFPHLKQIFVVFFRFLTFLYSSWNHFQVSVRVTRSPSSVHTPVHHLVKMLFTVWTLQTLQISLNYQFLRPPRLFSWLSQIWFCPSPLSWAVLLTPWPLLHLPPAGELYSVAVSSVALQQNKSQLGLCRTPSCSPLTF